MAHLADEERRALARAIRAAARLEGTFTLRSGATATEYFDKYQFEADPELLRRIAQALAGLVPKDTEVLAGLELGGVPLVTALSLELGLPAAFLRKTAKTYGTCRYAEGAALTARRCLLVEDVVSSGGALLDTLAMLRADGIEPIGALCVVDRESGGRENCAASRLPLHALYTRSALENA